jgi:hypothetical protein
MEHRFDFLHAIKSSGFIGLLTCVLALGVATAGLLLLLMPGKLRLTAPPCSPPRTPDLLVEGSVADPGSRTTSDAERPPTQRRTKEKT